MGFWELLHLYQLEDLVAAVVVVVTCDTVSFWNNIIIVGPCQRISWFLAIMLAYLSVDYYQSVSNSVVQPSGIWGD